MGISALSSRLVKEDVRRAALKTVRMDGWPLSRKIRIVVVRDHFTSKAVRRFLELVRKKMPESDLAIPKNLGSPGSLRGFST